MNNVFLGARGRCSLLQDKLWLPRVYIILCPKTWQMSLWSGAFLLAHLTPSGCIASLLPDVSALIIFFFKSLSYSIALKVHINKDCLARATRRELLRKKKLKNVHYEAQGELRREMSSLRKSRGYKKVKQFLRIFRSSAGNTYYTSDYFVL